MIDLTKKHRKPYPRVRKSRKTVFTPAIWLRWMVENPRLTPPSDEMTLRLRAGIADLRQSLGGVSHKEAHS
jgi:hypothetical protein